MNGNVADARPRSAFLHEVPLEIRPEQKGTVSDVVDDGAFVAYMADGNFVIDWNEPLQAPADAPQEVLEQMQSPGDIFKAKLKYRIPLGIAAVGLVDNAYFNQKPFNPLEDIITAGVLIGITIKTRSKSEAEAAENTKHVLAVHRNREQREDRRLRVRPVDRRFAGETAATVGRQIIEEFGKPKLATVITQEELLDEQRTLQSDRRVRYLSRAKQERLPIEGNKSQRYKQAQRLVTLTGNDKKAINTIDTTLSGINKRLKEMSAADASSLTTIDLPDVLAKVAQTGMPLETIIPELTGLAHYAWDLWQPTKPGRLADETSEIAEAFLGELAGILDKVAGYKSQQAEEEKRQSILG
jgi:hypothetical protein